MPRGHSYWSSTPAFVVQLVHIFRPIEALTSPASALHSLATCALPVSCSSQFSNSKEMPPMTDVEFWGGFQQGSEAVFPNLAPAQVGKAQRTVPPIGKTSQRAAAGIKSHYFICCIHTYIHARLHRYKISLKWELPLAHNLLFYFNI